MADNNCTQAQFLDKIVHIGNFNEFEDASGNAASATASCMISVIVMKCISIGVRRVVILRYLTLLDCVNKRENWCVHQVNTDSLHPSIEPCHSKKFPHCSTCDSGSMHLFQTQHI